MPLASSFRRIFVSASIRRRMIVLNIAYRRYVDIVRIPAGNANLLADRARSVSLIPDRGMCIGSFAKKIFFEIRVGTIFRIHALLCVIQYNMYDTQR